MNTKMTREGARFQTGCVRKDVAVPRPTQTGFGRGTGVISSAASTLYKNSRKLLVAGIAEGWSSSHLSVSVIWVTRERSAGHIIPK